MIDEKSFKSPDWTHGRGDQQLNEVAVFADGCTLYRSGSVEGAHWPVVQVLHQIHRPLLLYHPYQVGPELVLFLSSRR